MFSSGVLEAPLGAEFAMAGSTRLHGTWDDPSADAEDLDDAPTKLLKEKRAEFSDHPSESKLMVGIVHPPRPGPLKLTVSKAWRRQQLEAHPRPTAPTKTPSPPAPTVTTAPTNASTVTGPPAPAAFCRPCWTDHP